MSTSTVQMNYRRVPENRIEYEFCGYIQKTKQK